MVFIIALNGGNSKRLISIFTILRPHERSFQFIKSAAFTKGLFQLQCRGASTALSTVPFFRTSPVYVAEKIKTGK